mgnify:CR=1 FL=1
MNLEALEIALSIQCQSLESGFLQRKVKICRAAHILIAVQ